MDAQGTPGCPLGTQPWLNSKPRCTPSCTPARMHTHPVAHPPTHPHVVWSQVLLAHGARAGGPHPLQEPDEGRPAAAAAGARVAPPPPQLGRQLVGQGHAVAVARGDDLGVREGLIRTVNGVGVGGAASAGAISVWRWVGRGWVRTASWRARSQNPSAGSHLRGSSRPHIAAGPPPNPPLQPMRTACTTTSPV